MGKVGCEDCGKKLPIGPTGPIGNPSFLAVPCVEGGSAFATSAGVYQLVKNFIFSTDATSPFKKLKANVWMGAGTGKFRIREVISNTVLFESADIASIVSTNIETQTGLNIYPAVNAIIAIEVKSNNAGVDTINIGSVTFYGQ